MNILHKTFFIFFIAFAFAACETTTTNTPSHSDNPAPVPANPADAVDVDTPSTTRPVVRQSHNCEVKGKVLDGNAFWIKEKETLVCIAADESTADANLGDSHRILEIYDTKSCNQLKKEVLPVNVSPDYPYYLAQITYNKSSHLVGIRGFDKIYCYDVDKQQLLPALEPQFMSERFAEDAQSGMIKHLEVWEDYLVGYAQDMGVFAFQLGDDVPKKIMPFAEYALDETNFHPLFLLESKEGAYQALVPDYDLNTGTFNINPLFENHRKVSTQIGASARNNRFIVMREPVENSQPKPIAIDLQNRKKVDLPVDIASKNTGEILAWLRANS